MRMAIESNLDAVTREAVNRVVESLNDDALATCTRPADARSDSHDGTEWQLRPARQRIDLGVHHTPPFEIVNAANVFLGT